MANEFKHVTVGTEITQAEYESITGHAFDSQARGDIPYASSTTQLSRIAIGGAGAVLTSDGTDPVWDTTWSPTGHLIPASDDSYDLGSASAAWQDLFLEGDISLTDAGTISTAAGALTVGSAAAINITPTAGSAILLDGTISVDAGVVTGATSITSTAFVGGLTGNVTGNASGTAATVTTAAQSAITSLGTLTTLTVDSIIINGTNIGHTSDTDAIAISSGGVVTMNQIPVFSAGINVSGGTIAGTLATAAQANVTSLGTLTALTVDDVSVNGATIGHTSDTDLMTLADGVLTVAGELDATTLDVSGNADIDGTANLDDTDIDGTLVVDGSNISLDSTSTLNIDNSNTSNGVSIATATSGVPVTIGHGTSEVTVGDNLTVTGDLTVSGATTTASTTNTIVKDSLVELNNGASSNSNDLGIVMERGSTGDNAIIAWDESADVFTVGTTTATGASTGNLTITAAPFTAAAIVGTTIDASTDFTIGDTIITDGVITDSSGLSIAAAVDLGSNTLTSTGSLQVRTIDYSDGDLAMTIADGGGVTFAQAVDLGSNTLTTTGSLQVRTIDYSDGDNAITIADGGGTTFAAAVDLGSNTLTSTGSLQVRTIDYSDGDLAMTIADGGGVTFAQQVSLDKSILVDSTPANTVYSGITGTFTAGETLSVGECVYLKAADTKMWKAVSGAGGTGLITAEIMCVAVAAEAITADAAGVFLLQGFITSTAFPTYAIGETLYLPEAEQSSLNVPEGAAVDSTGDFVQVLGWASAANTIFFNPDFTIIEHA